MEFNRGDGYDELRQAAYKTAQNKPIKNLISFGKDAKTVKGEKFGVRTGIVYMAPADFSGIEMCPSRTRGCTAACLFTAGHGVYKNVKQGRLRRTYSFYLRRDEFMNQLVREIDREYRRLDGSMILAIRLNGTSDIAYEHIPVRADGKYYNNIFYARPHVQFYDYTKRVARLSGVDGIPNYHLTFSRAETTANHRNAQQALDMGVNVTVVFREEIPAEWNGAKVIDGDETDIRFWDQDGGPFIIGLKAKGTAVNDTSGFVVD